MIIDDHELLAESLRLSLVAEGYEVDVPVPEPAAVVEALADHHPDVVLLDLDLGDGGDGSVLVEALSCSGARVIVVSGTPDRMQVAACLEAGAHGYVSKS